ncbi:MAG: family 78 glycoside hydrolase catalytic domain [Oscillospiraceae bacterium]|nr:family 78 glycoside hydrolase catalytic domain [Oscillospiraceae bacterium]
MELKKHFITTNRPYQEGAVEVFHQRVKADSIKKATLIITALGLYEAEINGKKVGDALFTPGFTYYPAHLYYQSYDVTGMLTGNDILTVYLAQGWYCGRFTFDNKVQIYGEVPAASWILTVEGENGTEIFCSDDASVVAVSSPYDYAGFYDGETYNEKRGQEIFQPVKYEGHIPEIFEEGTMSVRIREKMPVRSVIKRGDVTILDFGQNFAGFITIDPDRMKGDCLRLRHGELLNADGSLYTTNLRKAKAEIIYHRGSGSYRPRFTYMGFRYAELSGVEYEDGLLSAYAIYSDMERTGFFTCDNPQVDRLYQNQVWGQKSNYIEVPTDCPQRDERMGYTGDGHVFALTGAYNFDTEAFWAKFLKDIRYSQAANKEGYVAPTVPAPPGEQGIGFMSMLGWGNCICIVPEMLYRQFGTDCYTREYYDCMKTFADCEIHKMGGLFGRKNLWIAPSLGDWLAMGRDVKYMAMHNGPVSNAFIVNDLRILVWAAKLLGKTADAEKYAAQLEKTRDAYIRAFVKKDGTMKDDYQGAYVMALQMVIPKGELWNRVYGKLIERIRRDGMQTGFFATEHILPLLADNGEEKLAFDLLLDERCGGWMYQVKAGATTTWERWDALLPDGTVNESKMSSDNMVSFNHYSFGSVGKFYYQYILGIQPLEPGFGKILIHPRIDSRIGAFSGSYRDIAVAWDGKKLHISTPAAAQIILPDGSIREVSAGTYDYAVQTKGAEL